MKRLLIISAFAVLLLTGCFRHGNSAVGNLDSQDSVITAAKLLSMKRTAGYTLVTVGDPWKGGVLHRYVLVPRDSVLPPDLPDGTLVRTPVSRALVYSSVHTSLLDELGAIGAVRGVVDSQYFIGRPIRMPVMGKSPNWIFPLSSVPTIWNMTRWVVPNG